MTISCPRLSPEALSAISSGHQLLYVSARGPGFYADRAWAVTGMASREEVMESAATLVKHKLSAQQVDEIILSL